MKNPLLVIEVDGDSHIKQREHVRHSVANNFISKNRVFHLRAIAGRVVQDSVLHI